MILNNIEIHAANKTFSYSLIQGRLVKAETKELSNGSRVTNLTLIVQRATMKENGDVGVSESYQRVSAFDGHSDLIASMKPGQLVAVEGYPIARSYTNKEGKTINYVEFRVQEVLDPIGVENSGSNDQAVGAPF